MVGGLAQQNTVYAHISLCVNGVELPIFLVWNNYSYVVGIINIILSEYTEIRLPLVRADPRTNVGRETNHSFWGLSFGGGGGGRTGRSNEFRGEWELFLFTITGSERFGWFSDVVLYRESDWLLDDREIFECDFSLFSTSDWSAESSPEIWNFQMSRFVPAF